MRIGKIARLIALIIAWPAGVLLVAAIAAAGVQYFSEHQDQRRLPAPGQLVDAGGHRLHIRCTGEGAPVVVLEAMGDGTSVNWAWVQPAIAKTTRVCAYDRAGRGWSEDGPAPRDAAHIAEELHALLANSGEPGPYVLVGHSFGGFVTRVLARAHPEDVAGMVIVDGGQPDIRSSRFPAEGLAHQAQDEQLMRAGPVLARLGLFRLRGFAPDLPSPEREQFAAFYSSTRLWDSLAAEMSEMPATDAQTRLATSLGATPLMVIIGSMPDDEITRVNNAMQLELLALSSNSARRVVAGASHASLVFDQNHAANTAEAILELVQAVRADEPLSAEPVAAEAQSP